MQKDMDCVQLVNGCISSTYSGIGTWTDFNKNDGKDGKTEKYKKV